MKIIFVCTRSITFNSFLKSQADYFIKKGFKVEVACSDNENLEFNKFVNHKISFPFKIIELLNIIRYIEIFLQINSLVKKNPSTVFFLHTPVASHLFRLFTFFKKIKIVYFVHGFRFTLKTSVIKAFVFKTIEKILSFKTDVFITINKEDYNYAKQNFSRRALCYKLNGVGLDQSIRNKKKKKFLQEKNKKNFSYSGL